MGAQEVRLSDLPPPWGRLLSWLPEGVRIREVQEVESGKIYRFSWPSSEDEAFLAPEGFYFGYNVLREDGRLDFHDLIRGVDLKKDTLDFWEDRWSLWGWSDSPWPFRSPLLRAWWVSKGAPSFDLELLECRFAELYPEMRLHLTLWEVGGPLVLALVVGDGEVLFRWR